MASRLKEYYLKSVVPALMDRFKYQEPHAGSRSQEGRGKHGVGRGDSECEDPGKRSTGDGSHIRPVSR